MTITDWRRSPPSPSLRLAPSPRGLLNHQHPFRLNCLHQASFIILHLIRSITRSSSPHPHPRSADTHTRRTRTHTHTHTSSLSPSSIYQSGSWAMLYWCCRRSWTSLTYMLGWHTLRGITRMHTHSGHHAQPCDTWDTTHAQTDERVVVVGWGWGIPAHVNTDVTTDMHSDITPWHVHRFLTHTQSLS